MTKSVTDATDIPSSVVKQSHNYRHGTQKNERLRSKKNEIYWIWRSKLPESEVEEDARTERRDLNLRLTLPRFFFFRESNKEQGEEEEEEEFCVEVTKEENGAATVAASIDSYSGDWFLC